MTVMDIKQVKPGMALGQEIHKPSDKNMGFKAGTVLDQMQIDLIGVWGFKQLEIQPVEEVEAKAEIPLDENQQLVAEQLQARFRHTDLGHPMMAELYRVCLMDELGKRRY